jgi:type II secretory pathway pseudopilin PulG
MPIRCNRVRLRARSGLSLLEAVVSVTIVGLTSVAALEAVGGDMRATERARRAIEAEALATSRLEVIGMLTERELQAIPDSVATGKFAKPLDEYQWTTQSAPISNQAGLYDVRVTVAWREGTYTVKTYEYRTPPIVSRR